MSPRPSATRPRTSGDGSSSAATSAGDRGRLSPRRPSANAAVAAHVGLVVVEAAHERRRRRPSRRRVRSPARHAVAPSSSGSAASASRSAVRSRRERRAASSTRLRDRERGRRFARARVAQRPLLLEPVDPGDLRVERDDGRAAGRCGRTSGRGRRLARRPGSTTPATTTSNVGRTTRRSASRDEPFVCDRHGAARGPGTGVTPMPAPDGTRDRSVRPDFDWRLDQIGNEVSPTGRDIARQCEARQRRQMQIVCPADPALEHAAVPERESPGVVPGRGRPATARSRPSGPA